MIYLRLFLSFCVIGALTIGGGYASLPLILQECVANRHWLTLTEFSDLITISYITPGPIAINAATFVGQRAGGILGAAIATTGFAVVPFIIVSALYFIYKRHRDVPLARGILSGLRPCVVALIAAAGLSILFLAILGESYSFEGLTSLITIALMLLAFIILRLKKPNPILIILACGALGAAFEFFRMLAAY